MSFIYTNPNPNGRNVGDCTVRAISICEDVMWEEVYLSLCVIGFIEGDIRLGIADLKYTVATENCADRQALNEGVRDIIANQTAGIQRILDQMCNDKIDAKNDEIAQLRQEVLYARGQASQIAQNGQIVDAIYNRLDTCPVSTTPVYGRTPIFTCNNNGCGCGCGNF